MAIQERILDGAEDDELLEWRRVVLSCPAAFIHLTTEEDIYFYATNKRVKAEKDYRVLTHKTTQMIFDVYNFKVKPQVEGFLKGLGFRVSGFRGLGVKRVL